jgi:hypothetical protein
VLSDVDGSIQLSAFKGAVANAAVAQGRFGSFTLWIEVLIVGERREGNSTGGRSERELAIVTTAELPDRR